MWHFLDLWTFPDHNALHASDVLHGVYYMTTGKIPGFCPLGTPPKLSSDDSDSDMEECIGGPKSKGYHGQSDGDYGCLVDYIPSLELLSLFTAAAMHDYDHPGRTNAFLVATLSQQVRCLFLFELTFLGWSVDWLGGLAGHLTGWVVWLAGQLTGWVVWLVSWLAGWFGWLVSWLAGWLAGQMTGWVVPRLTSGLLVGWSTGWSFDQWTDWLNDWSIYYLIDWLNYWFGE